MGADGGARPVVVGVDGSASSLDAVRWAVREAVFRRAPLSLVCCFDWLHARNESGEEVVGPDAVRAARVRADERLAEAAALVEELAPGRPVARCAVLGSPKLKLTEWSRTAALLVVGSRGLGGVRGLLVGSVTVALAADAACPVVVVHEGGRRVEGPVVVGVDGSPRSEAALAFAVEAAVSRGASLLAVHVWRDGLVDPAWAPIFDWDAIEEAESAVLAERLAGWGQRYPELDVVRLVARGFPAPVLVEQSARAQLVVVGSHGRGGLAGLALGSVGHAVLHRAHCPVAIVRPDTAHPDDLVRVGGHDAGHPRQ